MDAVILAGGLGTRLKPFTDIIPKPLLPLGEKSLMEIQIEHLKKCGFNNIYIAVNYKSDYIKAFFGDGSKYGVNIYYSEEEKPLGTAGPLKLLEKKLLDPFLVINGDILTNFDLRKIYEFSLNYPESPLTLGTKIITTPFRFGKIYSEGDIVKDIEEKPELKFEILAGIYIMKPKIFEYIPYNEYFGIDLLIKKLLSKNIQVTKYIINDYWIDIGVVEDYSKAKELYENMKNN
ncbi:Nucleoside-diphosphate-sugar pyrophosphorylase family protein [Marinitoga piezophila KA3]|uniref:Nucleoside-diphosphate-sugar pyrophosphorylase family protein n=1 Tax=Marinitoga piezophila (strain DSM 14283 / JCM 11233 / KA3) TaxID=443254 RepID=H2J2W8_MARPK|nr:MULTISPECIES: sugar phosphate nucleotidyltransferase [Marinitoga]AEX85659.1 Nucleoside-diphosphate-sugar pyrophosphorylase family protein [Marinitoga piezophila KA3]APT76111.1 mannose-1-phosphate guanyltransferase [Marinitoga sp. 1137]